MFPKIWYRWLVADTIALMVFGLGLVLFPNVTKRMFSLLIYLNVDYISSSFAQDANRYVVLVHGVLGAVMFGWGLLMFLVLKGPFLQPKPFGWSLMAIPLTAWFI